jgi:putative nucleotidyltransferase with HDIG domain
MRPRRRGLAPRHILGLTVALSAALAAATHGTEGTASRGHQPEETAPPGITREQAVAVLEARVPGPERRWHAVAVEAIMRALAEVAGGVPDQWGLAGLMHDVDRTETDATPSRHGIVGAAMLRELGFSEEVAHAVETHDDGAGRPRSLPIDHALDCADQMYWRILASGLRPGTPEFSGATPEAVLDGLDRAGESISERLREECTSLGPGLDAVLALSLDAMRALPAPAPATP